MSGSRVLSVSLSLFTLLCSSSGCPKIGEQPTVITFPEVHSFARKASFRSFHPACFTFLDERTSMFWRRGRQEVACRPPETTIFTVGSLRDV